MLTRRFVTEREVIGRTAKEALALHRLNAMGCSERAEARKLMSKEYKDMLDHLHACVKQDGRFKDISLNELDRALLWGCLRYRAWSDKLTLAVVSEAGCFFGAMIAINVYNGGYSDRELDGRCALGATPTPASPRPSLALRVRARTHSDCTPMC